MAWKRIAEQGGVGTEWPPGNTGSTEEIRI